MKHTLKLTTAIAAALLVAACSPDDNDNGWSSDNPTRICTDRSGTRVPDNQCRQGAYAQQGSSNNAFLWYYLGRNSSVPYYGERSYGGSYRPAARTSYFSAPRGSSMTRASSISRGGFGSSAHGFGGFGG